MFWSPRMPDALPFVFLWNYFKKLRLPADFSRRQRSLIHEGFENITPGMTFKYDSYNFIFHLKIVVICLILFIKLAY